MLYCKRWSVRIRVPRVARLDSLYCTRNWPSARLDSLYPQGIANFCFAAIGGEVSSVWTQALLPAACVWRCIEYPVHQGIWPAQDGDTCLVAFDETGQTIVCGGELRNNIVP